MISKIFKLLSILSAIALIGYTIFSWNKSTNQSMLISQLLMMSMLVFGGIDNLLSKKNIMKGMGIIFLAVAIFIAVVSIIKYG
ncbi:hypothetical protein [Neobacillus soli]|uniref:hypothetical protein n=1 Tax=Neobacillus soli TaxID=220688 RepID=UPI00082461CB|nr:hypothetical protein [Neobacillus soli]